jgi:hypothetical protein
VAAKSSPDSITLNQAMSLLEGIDQRRVKIYLRLRRGKEVTSI